MASALACLPSWHGMYEVQVQSIQSAFGSDVRTCLPPKGMRGADIFVFYCLSRCSHATLCRESATSAHHLLRSRMETCIGDGERIAERTASVRRPRARVFRIFLHRVFFPIFFAKRRGRGEGNSGG